MAPPVNITKSSEFRNPSALSGAFGTQLLVQETQLFVSDDRSDYVDVFAETKYAKAGVVYSHNVELGTTSTIVSPNPIADGHFGSQMASSALHLCIREKTIDTEHGDSGLVHIFDRETLTHITSIPPPPTTVNPFSMIKPRMPSISCNENFLFLCYGGDKMAVDHIFHSEFEIYFDSGTVQFVSLDPLSPLFGSVIKSITAPVEETGRLRFNSCTALGEVLLVSYFKEVKVKNKYQTIESGFVLYDLRFLHYVNIPYKLVRQSTDQEMLASNSYRDPKLHASVITFRRIISIKMPNGFYKFGSEQLVLYDFIDFDNFDANAIPTIIASPIALESGFGQFVSELDGVFLVSTPYAAQLSDGTKYFGDIYSIDKASLKATEGPMVMSILSGDVARQRLGNFAATADYLAVGLPYGEYGGVVEIYSIEG